MIRKIAKLALITTFALLTHNQIWGNLDFGSAGQALIKTSLILSLFEIILKPVIKFLLLPINILTLGAVRLVINTLGFYLAVFLIPGFKLLDISTSACRWQGVNIPPLQFSGFFAYLVTSLSLNLIIYFFNKILYKKPKS